MKAGTHLYLQGLELVGGEPLMYVMRDETKTKDT